MRVIYLILAIFLESFCFASEANKLNIEFFNRFSDNYLPHYIEAAINNNHNLKEAQHKLNQYRFEIQKAISYELPELSAMPGYLGVHFPRGDYNIFLKNNSFILPMKVSFEADLLLKNYDKIKKSKADYLAQIAKKNNLYLSLLTEVASNYINILLYDYLIKKQEEILSNDNNIIKKENLKLNFGTIDKFAINKIEDEIDKDKIEFSDLIKKRNTILYNFCNLIGESAENYDEIKRGDIEDFEYLETIPEIISSDLIYDRFDIVEVENKLKSAKIDIKIAKKEFFPKFDITGLLVFDTLGKGNFFGWESSFAFLIANAAVDVFQGGRKIANLKIKNEKFKELLEEYKEKELVAIKEINNALNLIKEDKSSENNHKKRYTLEKNNLYLSEKKLKNGVISELEYLYNKNDLIEKEKNLLTSKAIRIVDYITLYKALGGNL